MKLLSGQNTGWKVIFRYLFRHKAEVITLSFLGVLSAFSNSAIPYLVGNFFDALLGTSSLRILTFLIPLWAWYLAIWVMAQILANSTDFVNNRIGRRIGTHLHTEYYAGSISHLLGLPLSFHKEYKTGETLDKIQRASSGLSSIIEQVIIGLTPRVLSVFIGFGFAFYISPLLALMLLVGIIAYVASLWWIVPPLVSLQREGHKAWGDAYGVAHDAVANYHTVKQSTAEDYESKRINQKFIEGVFRLWQKVENIWVSIDTFQRVIVFLTQLLIFLLSVYLIGRGSLSIGELIAINGYAGAVFGPFVVLGYNWQIIQNGIVAIERAEEILGLPTESTLSKEKKGVDIVHGKVQFKNISFRYKDGLPIILKNVNFMVQPGETVAFVGHSGVGKSTILELISGYYLPTSGEVLIDDIDIKTINLLSLRRHIAVVPQEVVLFNDTIEMNIKYGSPDATLDEIVSAAKMAHVDVIVEKFPDKYQQIVGERGVKLSVGEKQRVAIARAILRNPRILILDEPTSALDIITERYVIDALEYLMKNRTTFIIAHRLSTVRKADTIFVLERGEIQEQGNHSDLIKKKNGIYRKLYDLHVGLT